MSPVTRSASRPQASSSKRALDHDEPPPSSTAIDSPSEEEQEETKEEPVTVQGLLKQALRGARYLERDNEALRKKARALEEKLGRLQEADDALIRPKRTQRAAVTVTTLQREVHRLEAQVGKLEKSKEKYRKRIHELRMKEIKTDADELADGAEFEVGDSAYTMRKLLRRFHDLMMANSLEEGSEECPICMEPLKPKECRSLPCQHMFCNDCVQQLKPVQGDPYIESICCPQCRNVCQKDELELVEYTASEQWDALLDVAKRWARMDIRREAETSEEEDEENFIVEGEGEDDAR
ncbi:hypothetical protein DICSQDRAFT_169335 [Dichomitus squalens LYAD-421 SS1]|uniref:RING-type domain-containing protein n=1 Tax=Dichomitus squalens (strain LYAD-421) TaxID=732165 RepID=R7T201_DICSQ|nr:uncharacterized protein DICSQDRAFT_169335 [Dichomitus squalens LYAD-421 SS1]EJF62303.1 hypothetical protein DICSQDRAFT_169335 [Dichomitus squalens LYAD-421 SS1]